MDHVIIYEKDPNSFANVDDVILQHAELDFTVDFTQKILKGRVTYTFKVLKEGVHEVILDTSYLEVLDVAEADTSQKLEYSLDERDDKFGSALRIKLSGGLMQRKGGELKLIIQYNTTKHCTALGWMEPGQTSGKNHPFLFSQCQAIHARSLLPCQDTPSVKFSYVAMVTVPAPLVAVMSAVPSKVHKILDNSMRAYHFHQDIPIPSYLLALACGLLEKREIGPRSAVWAEKEIIEEAASEFVDTEKFIKTGEDLTIPYVWGRYDILVLPRNFPYGGMENPCLTFVTPTIISGDRSLVNVVAHEIAHSWMGNLVTPSNWQHFWLNEGFTVFLERKIIGRLQGDVMAEFKAILGLEELEKSVKLYGEQHPFTHLVPDLKGEDPDDAFSSIPYEKGFNFLYYLQRVVGGPTVFEPYIKAHVKKFQYKSITSQDFKEYFLEHFGELAKKGKLDEIDWKAWFHAPGYGPVKNSFNYTLAEACSSLAEKWQKNQNIADFKKEEYTSLSPEQKVVFLTHLGSQTPVVSESTLSKMDQLYNVSAETNNEIKFRWQMASLLADYEPILTEVVKFLGSQGRMKYVRPLYRTLAKNHKDLAVKTFLANKNFYHPIAVKQLTSDLQI